MEPTLNAAAPLPWYERAFRWLAVGVLAAGAIFFLVSTLRGPEAEGPLPPAPAQRAATAKPGPIDPRARQVASKFILTAVARKDLAASWELVHPELKAGYTLAEWKKGDIPVIPFPVDNLDHARFKVDENFPNQILLQVALIPRKGADVRATTFFLGLRAVGKGQQRRWLVDYWMPRWTPPVPDVR